MPSACHRDPGKSSAPGPGRRVARQPQLPCATTARAGFTSGDAYDHRAAAQICASCPLADACLHEAFRLDTAHRAGTDPYGAYGCWGGVWFEPGHPPEQLLHSTAVPAR